MATVPISGTNIYLLRDVPFHSDYRDTRYFDNRTQQTNWFLGKTRVHSIQQATFQRIEGNNIIRADVSIDALWGANYVMFQNREYNNKWFYGFIVDLEYKQKNTTHVHFQIDVFQTWWFDVRFRPSYVVREHRPLWNSDGTPVINTVPEGLEYGTEYDTVHTERYRPTATYRWMVVATKKLITTGDIDAESSVLGAPQPLHYYVVPFGVNGTHTPTIRRNGTDFEVTNPLDLLDMLYKTEGATNNVVSIYITDYIGVDYSYNYNTDTISFAGTNETAIAFVIDGDGDEHPTLLIRNVPNFKSIRQVLTNNKYSGLRTVKESKLLMYPYTTYIMDDFKGNRIEFRLEHIHGNQINIITKGSLGPSNYVTYAIENYNRSGDVADYLTSNENALVNANPTDIPILTDMLSAYLQGNKNSLQNQRDRIHHNLESAGIGAVAGVANSTINKDAFGVAGSLTDFFHGAVGNNALDKQALQAQRADIDNQPPSIANMGVNTSYDTGNDYNGVVLMKKQIKPEYVRKLQDFFNMYGYKTNEVKVPNFHTRRYWNYVQTSTCVILGNMNNRDLQELKNIFDNGITLWHTDDVGNYWLDNEVI